MGKAIHSLKAVAQLRHDQRVHLLYIGLLLLLLQRSRQFQGFLLLISGRARRGAASTKPARVPRVRASIPD